MGRRGCRGSQLPAVLPLPFVLPASSLGKQRPRAAAWQGMQTLGSAPRLVTSGSGAGGTVPAGESYAVGVRFPTAPWCPSVSEHVWLKCLILDYLEARESLCGDQGLVRIRAVLVQAGTARHQLGPSLQHLLELQRGAGRWPCQTACCAGWP